VDLCIYDLSGAREVVAEFLFFFAPSTCEKNGVGSQQLSKKGVGIVGRYVLGSTGRVLVWLQGLPCDPNQ
jgi:hypothetical protein